jgi:uncharacterized protein (DUF1810 family)
MASQEADLTRFVQAQEPVYDGALAELLAGRKTTHWMWFVFPQVQGLGRSAMAQRFALSGLEEARAYLADPVLGPRLRECAAVLVGLPGNDALAVMGSPDDVKLRSSMTLFAATSQDRVFQDVLDKYFGGEPDPATLERL